MATASSMIVSSLIMIGEKAVGGTLTSAEQTYWLSRLNAFLESWSLDRLLVYQLLQESKALTVSVGTYTIGTGGDFNTTRPNRIADPCFVRDSQNVDVRIQIVDAVAYGRIILKTVDGSYPRYLYYDTAYVGGLGTIFLYPEPLSGLTLYINSWKQLQSFAAITDTVALPPGYQLAIESNFAIHAAAGFKPVSQEVIAIAKQSKAAIMALNLPSAMMRLDSGLPGTRYRGTGNSILTGY